MDIDTHRKTTVGSFLSIRFWIQNETKQSGEFLVQSVTKGKSEEETHILFNTTDYSEVHKFVKDIEEIASNVFNDKIKEFNGTKKFEDSYNMSTSQRSYMSALSETTVSLPWQASNPQSTSQKNKGFKKRKPLVYGVASVMAKEMNPVPTRNSGYNNTGKKLNEDMVASKLLIEKLQEEVKELKSGGLPTMKDLQEQVDIMIQKSDVKVEKMWIETSKFVNCLEDKVQAKQQIWEKIQKEVVEVQNQRLTSLDKYKISREKHESNKEKKRTKMIEDDKIKVEMYQEREEKIAAFLNEGREFQAKMDVKVTELERYK